MTETNNRAAVSHEAQEESFMPIGSVVLLKEAQKRLMIVGRLQRGLDNNEIYDYAGCLWPEGVISSERFYLFNHQDIDTVYFIGFQDPEEFEFRPILSEKKAELHHQCV